MTDVTCKDYLDKTYLPESMKNILGKYENAELVFKDFTQKAQGFDEDERAAIHWVTTNDVDRDKEVILPEGINRDEFEAFRTVFYNHDYNTPIGSNVWQKRKTSNGSSGILAKTRFATDEFSDTLYDWVQDDIIRAASIGIIILDSVWREDEGFGDTMSKLKKKNPNIKSDGIDRIITKSVQLEYSIVGVPSNPAAIMVAVNKGGLTEEDLKAKGIEIKALEPEPEPEPEIEPIIVHGKIQRVRKDVVIMNGKKQEPRTKEDFLKEEILRHKGVL